jgi:hypothetical protein
MPHRSHDTYDWREDDDAFEAAASPASIALAGLPASWHSYDWWMAGIAFASVWILDVWTSSESLLGLTTGLLGLAVTLTVCCGIHRLCRPYSVRLAQAFCIVTAIGTLIWRAV